MIILRLINLDDPANPECIQEIRTTMSIAAEELADNSPSRDTAWARHARPNWDAFTLEGRRFHKIEIVREGDE